MNRRTRCSSILPMAIVMFVLLAIMITNTEAGRGCLSYGHSCLGGFGKRSVRGEFTGPMRNLRDFSFDDKNDQQFKLRQGRIIEILKDWLKESTENNEV